MRVAKHGLLLLSTRSANTDEHGTALAPRNSRGGGGTLNFIVIILSEDFVVGLPLGRCVAGYPMLAHMYIPSSMLWEGSDLIVAAGKKF